MIYRRLVGARIRADWQYRTSFALFFVGQALVAAFDLVTIAVIFGRVDLLAGWSFEEVAFLYGVSTFGFGLSDLFISQVETASLHIKAGTFDQFLIRPVSPLLQLSAMEFATRRIGRSIPAAAVLVLASTNVDVSWDPPSLLLVPITVVSSAAIFGALFVITSSLAFWTVETQEIANSFTYGGSFLSSYPIDVLGRWVRRFVTFVVPLASVAYLPAAWLFDKPLPFGLPALAAWSGPVVATMLVLVARGVWGLAIRNYRSTGS